jgi:uncharacterized membrane protein
MTRRAPYLMLALALIGIVDASYDSYAIYTDQLLWCPPPIDGCNTVAASPYARVLGVPLGYFGVVYYLCMFALAARLAFGAATRGWRAGALSWAAMGVAFSAYFMYIQLTFIHAFCIYCLISGVLTLLLLAAALQGLRHGAKVQPEDRELHRRPELARPGGERPREEPPVGEASALAQSEHP